MNRIKPYIRCALYVCGIIVGLMIIGYLLEAAFTALTPVLGFLSIAIMTISSLTLIVLGIIDLFYWHKEDISCNISGIIFGGIIAYFFIFHVWPKQFGH